jgi:hypothetical protein
MVRRIVMMLNALTKLPPDRIMTIFIVVGSIVICEVLILLAKLILRKIRSRNASEQGTNHDG